MLFCLDVFILKFTVISLLSGGLNFRGLTEIGTWVGIYTWRPTIIPSNFSWRLTNYLAFKSFDYERNRWRLFQRRCVRTTLDIYAFITYIYALSYVLNFVVWLYMPPKKTHEHRGSTNKNALYCYTKCIQIYDMIKCV